MVGIDRLNVPAVDTFRHSNIGRLGGGGRGVWPDLPSSYGPL